MLHNWEASFFFFSGGTDCPRLVIAVAASVRYFLIAALKEAGSALTLHLLGASLGGGGLESTNQVLWKLSEEEEEVKKKRS